MNLGTYFSWTIFSNDLIVKTTDKSVYADGGSGIPKQTRWFWNVEDINPDNDIPIKLFFNDTEHTARITMSNGRTRIFWPSLVQEFRHIHPTYHSCDEEDYPSLFFKRRDYPSYDVFFSEGIYSAPQVTQVSSVEGRTEGRVRYYHSKTYERNPQNRAECIRIHGTKCIVCGFDFEAAYGEWGAGYIEVHHRKAIHTFEEEKTVNPETDLSPVCANCHRMLHRKRDYILSVEELRQMLHI